VSEWSNAVGSIVLASTRDLQWRSRRFLLAAVATGMVFGVALLMSGVANSFTVEINNTVNELGATSWLVRAGSPGPFTDPAPFPSSSVAVVRRVPGVEAADPIVVGRALTAGAITSAISIPVPASSEKDIQVLGVVPGGVGAPHVVAGRPLAAADSVVVDESLGVGLGQKIALNGMTFNVVGLVNGVTYFAGQPVAFVTINAADRLNVDGEPLATAVLIKGTPTRPIPGFTVLTDAQVRTDLGRPITQADPTIKLIEVLLWVVAAGIIGAIVYLSALELALAQRSNQAGQDLEQLYRRIVFSILTSNVDDHLRNHAFLRRRTDWVLSPAYDLNPDPKTTGFLSTAVDFDDPSADIDLALSAADYFRLSRADARGIVAEVELATRGWAAAARALGLPGDEVDLMGQAFETEQRQVARRVGA
jgi:putative ABC transport system permease protein